MIRVIKKVTTILQNMYADTSKATRGLNTHLLDLDCTGESTDDISEAINTVHRNSLEQTHLY